MCYCGYWRHVQGRQFCNEWYPTNEYADVNLYCSIVFNGTLKVRPPLPVVGIKSALRPSIKPPLLLLTLLTTLTGTDGEIAAHLPTKMTPFNALAQTE